MPLTDSQYTEMVKPCCIICSAAHQHHDNKHYQFAVLAELLLNKTLTRRSTTQPQSGISGNRPRPANQSPQFATFGPPESLSLSCKTLQADPEWSINQSNMNGLLTADWHGCNRPMRLSFNVFMHSAQSWVLLQSRAREIHPQTADRITVIIIIGQR